MAHSETEPHGSSRYIKEGMILAVVGALAGTLLSPPGILAGAALGASIGWSIEGGAV